MTNTTYPARLAEVVRQQQQAAGLSDLALAEATTIPRATLQRRLKSGDFYASELAAVADALGTTAEALASAARQVAA